MDKDHLNSLEHILDIVSFTDMLQYMRHYVLNEIKDNDEALKYFHINEGIYNAINARDNLEAHQEFLLAIERAIELNSVD